MICYVKIITRNQNWPKGNQCTWLHIEKQTECDFLSSHFKERHFFLSTKQLHSRYLEVSKIHHCFAHYNRLMKVASLACHGLCKHCLCLTLKQKWLQFAFDTQPSRLLSQPVELSQNHSQTEVDLIVAYRCSKLNLYLLLIKFC